MPYVPQVVGNSTLEATTLNAIGADIGVGVTVVADNIYTLQAYGNVVTTNTSMMNKWYDKLINLIIEPRIYAKMYQDRLNPFNKGVLDIGDGVEEIFVAPANVHQANQDKDNPDGPFNADLPNIYTAWHVTNAEMKYSVRVKKTQLRRAFRSFSAMDAFVNNLTTSLYSGYEWDSQLLKKYKLAQMILSKIANDKDVSVASPLTSDGTAFLAGVREYAELFKWMSDSYNDAGVPGFTDEADRFVVMPAGVEANVDVKDLAAAFNLDYAQFIGRRLPVDRFTFTTAEKNRIMEIAGLDSWSFTDEQETSLGTVLGVICDVNIGQFYDTYEPELWDQKNGGEAEFDFWLHASKICGISPFANAVVFTAGADEPANLNAES